MIESQTTTEDIGDAIPQSATGVLTIDLAAICENYRRLHQAGGMRGTAAMVKADAYGLGAEAVAPALARCGARSFFVSTLDEGLALRPCLDAAVPACSIYVLNGPMAGCEALYQEQKLLPVLNSLGQLEAWRRYNKARDQVLPAALHLDTGMSRLGFPPQELEKLAEHQDLLAGTLPVLVMSHLVSSEEADNPLNPRQLEAFKAAIARLPKAPASLANSSGIFLGEDYHFDLVRPGAALFGVNPTPGKTNPMSQVVNLKGKILQVRWIDAPQSVGYGATHKVKRPARIATVAAGYADGAFRSLSNRGKAWAAGREVPVVGRVSMDLLTIDITELHPDALGPGDFVDLLCAEHDVDALAQEAGTIGYEILTGLGRRYHRIYCGGNG